MQQRRTIGAVLPAEARGATPPGISALEASEVRSVGFYTPVRSAVRDLSK